MQLPLYLGVDESRPITNLSTALVINVTSRIIKDALHRYCAEQKRYCLCLLANSPSISLSDRPWPLTCHPRTSTLTNCRPNTGRISFPTTRQHRGPSSGDRWSCEAAPRIHIVADPSTDSGNSVHSYDDANSGAAHQNRALVFASAQQHPKPRMEYSGTTNLLYHTRSNL